MIDILENIKNGISGLSGTALIYTGALAIAGTISMAFLQLVKELTPIRRAFQRHWLESWFEARSMKFTSAAESSPSGELPEYLPLDPQLVQLMLIELATGGEENAFYALEIEQLVAQMNAAAQIALEYPHVNFPLVAVLSQGASLDDVALVVTHAKEDGREPDQTILNARNRVGHRIQRNLDGIQIALSSSWKWWMQLSSITLTVLFVEWAIVTNVTNYNFATLLVGLVLGIVGGYLAPVTRDLVAALQKLRKA